MLLRLHTSWNGGPPGRPECVTHWHRRPLSTAPVQELQKLTMVNNEKDELLTMMQQTQGENSDRVTEVTLQSTSQQHPSKAQAAPAPR